MTVDFLNSNIVVQAHQSSLQHYVGHAQWSSNMWPWVAVCGSTSCWLRPPWGYRCPLTLLFTLSTEGAVFMTLAGCSCRSFTWVSSSRRALHKSNQFTCTGMVTILFTEQQFIQHQLIVMANFKGGQGKFRPFNRHGWQCFSTTVTFHSYWVRSLYDTDNQYYMQVFW